MIAYVGRAQTTRCGPRVCSATDYPVAQRPAYLLTDRREIVYPAILLAGGEIPMSFAGLKRRDLITLLGGAAIA